MEIGIVGREGMQNFKVFVDDTGLKFIIVAPGATGSWLTMPPRSAPGNLDKYPHMLMVLVLMEHRFDGI